MRSKMLKTALFSVASFMVITTMLAGCAMVTARVPLRYTPRGTAAVVPGARNVIVTVSVKDLRKRKRIGTKTNGFGMSMAPIYSKTSVGAMVRRAFEKELSDRGFRVADASPVHVDVHVTQLDSHFDVGVFTGTAAAEFHMTVMVRNRGGQETFSRTIAAAGKNGGVMIASGSNAGVAVDRAVENGVHMVFHDNRFIAALLHSE